MAERKAVNWVKEDAIAIITLDNPPVNQFGDIAMDETVECLNEIRQDGDVKAVIFTAAGTKVFCGGADLKSVSKYFKNYNGAAEELCAHGQGVFNEFAKFPKPVIAAMNGHTLGGGLELAMSCDMRVSAPDIKIGVPEITLGMIPGGGGTQRLARLVGYGRAMEMMLTGESITPQEAKNIGLVNIVASSREETLETAKVLARKIASFSSDSICLMKRAAYFGAMRDIQEGLDFEKNCFGQIYKSTGAREGVAAFLEKRKPDFSDL